MDSSFTTQMDEALALVEQALATYFPGQGLEEAMRYSLLAGGKRIRPILTVKFCEAAGGTMEEALDFGCAVEMLHTYTLIHDDLPCMDNDDLRRGKPTNHKVYGECVATLAGDALQAAAFRTVLTGGKGWRSEGRIAPLTAASVLASAVGEHGMCAGQYWDTLGDGQPHTLEELTRINDLKTGALLRAACIMGVLASSGHRKVDDACIDAAKAYATEVGLAFQIRDDILDAISTAEKLGKTVGSDAANAKSTYVSLLGVEACEEAVRTHTANAIAALERGVWRGDTGFLKALAEQLAGREV